MSGPTPSVQFAWDGPGALGVDDDAKFLRWNDATRRFEMASGAGGATVLSDLSDWPAPTAGYYLRRNAGDTAYEWAAVSGGVTDHGALTGLGDDDHAQYLFLSPATGSRNRLNVLSDGAQAVLFGVAGLTSTYASLDVSDYGGAAAVKLAVGGGPDYILKRPGYGEWATGWVVNFSTQSYYTQFHQRCYFFSLYGDVPQIAVRGSVSQTSNLTEWQGSDGTVIGAFGPSGTLTATALEVIDSGSVIQFAIGATGKILTNQAATNTNTPSGATAKALPVYDAAGTLLGYAPLYAAPW